MCIPSERDLAEYRSLLNTWDPTQPASVTVLPDNEIAFLLTVRPERLEEARDYWPTNVRGFPVYYRTLTEPRSLHLLNV